MIKVVVTTGAIRRAKLQIVITNKPTPSYLQAGCLSCRPTNSFRALKEEAPKKDFLENDWRAQRPGLFNFGLSLLRTRAPFDAELPNLTW